MNEIWQRRLLYLAGGWNVVGGLSAVLDPGRHFASLYSSALSLHDPLQAFFFRCTWINVVAWGVAYVLAALQPPARAVVLLAGGAGKLVYCGACVSLFLSGVGNSMLLAAGAVDFAFAGLFAYVVWYGRGRGR